MHVPTDLRSMLNALRRVGRPRLVGGGVRDWLLGITAKDFDVEVAGVDFEVLHRALAPFGATDVIGRSFGVIKVRSAESGDEYDFSLPRRESKTGSGHRGFAVAPDPGLSDAEAAARRDFTVNAIAYDPFSEALIDPYDGQSDLQKRVLRHTSSAFVEDPLRVLRAFQLAARFDFSLAPETTALCRQISDTFTELPLERIWGEWLKWATKSVKPSRGLEVLEVTNWLRHFPEIAALRGTPQEPEWHPEGDVFTHTQKCVDALVQLPEWIDFDHSPRLTFAVLAHDFGKPAVTQKAEKNGRIRWTSPGHASKSGPLAESFLRRIGAPLDFGPFVRALVEHHHAHDRANTPFTDAAIRRLAHRLVPATIRQLAVVMRSDSRGRPPLSPEETETRIASLVERATALEFEQSGPTPIVKGRHLLALGHRPGPLFKRVLDQAFEAQLDGTFSDEIGGVAWLETHLQASGVDLR
ncbi:MAG: polynucleotide adenylyltransferase [Opitutus sp.]